MTRLLSPIIFSTCLSWILLSTTTPALAFAVPSSTSSSSSSSSSSALCLMSAAEAASAPTMAQLYDPVARDAHYDGNTASYLVDLHDTNATFDFCGGMLFQLVLTDALRTHLVGVQNDQSHHQPVVFDDNQPRMSMTSNYEQTSQADNVHIFHGREIRQVDTAVGGMGMVLQLSLASAAAETATADPQGWTPQEQDRYDGWGHDSGREWRKGPQLEQEGFVTFRDQFGPNAFALHHRFYLHNDSSNRMWLSAEDGCEGTPAAPKQQ